MSHGEATAHDVSKTGVPYALGTSAFASALLDPDMPIPAGVGRDGNQAPKRFSVYRNNVVVSLMEALASAFPSILAIMGKENFDRVARLFVTNHPPASPMMQNYGSEFPAFLETFKPLRNSPFLIDLARAERAWLDAWHATDEMPLTPEELGAIEPDEAMELVLKPLSATSLIQSDFPVFTLFNARQTWPAPAIDLKEGQNLLITRPSLECIATSLDASQAVFVRQLVCGQPLGASIGEAMALDQSFDAGGAIALILQTGAFAALDGNKTDI